MELKILMLDQIANCKIVSPELIQYDHIGFYKRKTISKGLIDRCEYFLSFDGQNYSNLYVDVIFEYNFNGTVYIGQTTTVKWINIDETVGYTKVFPKEFTDWEKIEFGMQKRQNLISTAKLYALEQLGIADGSDLLFSVEDQLTAYLNGTPPTMITTEINSLVGVKTYLTQQIASGINTILTDI